MAPRKRKPLVRAGGLRQQIRTTVTRRERRAELTNTGLEPRWHSAYVNPLTQQPIHATNLSTDQVYQWVEMLKEYSKQKDPDTQHLEHIKAALKGTKKDNIPATKRITQILDQEKEVRAEIRHYSTCTCGQCDMSTCQCTHCKMCRDELSSEEQDDIAREHREGNKIVAYCYCPFCSDQRYYRSRRQKERRWKVREEERIKRIAEQINSMRERGPIK